MVRTNLDLDVLRSLVAGVDLGSFAKAADRLGRSTSALSSQLRKLDAQAGAPMFRRDGRGLALTEAGEVMLGYARRLLALNDEAVDAIRGQEIEGWVRLGLQADFGESLLSAVLGRFARAHPKVRVEARIARNAELLEGVASGRLDLALAWHDGVRPVPGDLLAEVPLRWIGGAEDRAPLPPSGEPVPLVALEAPCVMRRAATDALDRAGIPWRIAFQSQSLSGIWAAVSAGLGVTVRTQIGLPHSVAALATGAPFPDLPRLALALCRGQGEPSTATTRLGSLLAAAIGEVVPAAPFASPTPQAAQ